MPSYKLSYFPIKGLGEVSRMLFVLGGESFEDDRIPFEKWPDVKSGTPFGQLPVLYIDGQPLPQSFAIARYLATKFGFAGRTPFEAAWVDALADEWKDYYVAMRPVATGYMEKGHVDEHLRKDVAEPARDRHFGNLEKAARAIPRSKFQENGSNGNLVGPSLTWVDLLVAEHVTAFEAIIPGFFDGFPAVKEVQKAVQEEPRLKEYLANRPETYF